MKTFEKFHPLLTQHFRMDWPNTFPLKDFLTFIRETNFKSTLSASDIAQDINHQMEAIMKAEKLTYGIIERGTNNFVGVINLEFDGPKVHLIYSVRKQFDIENVQREIFDYIFAFLKENFEVKEIWGKKIELSASWSLLCHYGFIPGRQQIYRRKFK